MCEERPYNKFGKVLLAALGSMTQVEVAHFLHVSPVAVNKWVNGVSRPQPVNLGHLCAIFGLSLEYLAILAGYDIRDIDVMEKIEGAYRDRLVLRGEQEAGYESVET